MLVSELVSSLLSDKARSRDAYASKKMHQFKSYSQNKIDTTIMDISLFEAKYGRLWGALPIDPQSSSLYFWNQWK